MELNENAIVSLSGLLNTDKDTVIKAITGEDSAAIDEVTKNLVVRTKADAEKYELNLLSDFKQKHVAELKEKAKKKELDPELYNFFKGNIAEEFERKLSKNFGVDEFEGFDDLMTKIKNSKSTDEETKKMIADLQARNNELATEKEAAIKEAQLNFNSELLKMKTDAVYKSIPLDYADEAKEKQLSLLKNTIAQTYDFKVDGGNIVTIDKDGNVLKDKNTLEPVSFNDVVLQIAKAYDFKIKSPESGGQGGNSSAGEAGKGMSFDEYRKSKGVKAFTSDADKLYAEWRAINK